MTFSPRKLRISTRLAPLVMETLMGKWEYTKRILYSKPLVTPVIAFSMWLTHVRIDAVALPPVNHFSTTTLRSSEPSSKKMSIGMCLKLSSREPRGPVTLTARDLIANVTPSTISSVCLFWVNFYGRGGGARLRAGRAVTGARRAEGAARCGGGPHHAAARRSCCGSESHESRRNSFLRGSFFVCRKCAGFQ